MGRYVDRWRVQKPGFRAKISSGHYVFETGNSIPVAGPFPTAGAARREMRNMSEKTKTVEETTKRTEEETTDPPASKADEKSGEATSDGEKKDESGA